MLITTSKIAIKKKITKQYLGHTTLPRKNFPWLLSEILQSKIQLKSNSNTPTICTEPKHQSKLKIAQLKNKMKNWKFKKKYLTFTTRILRELPRIYIHKNNKTLRNSGPNLAVLPVHSRLKDREALCRIESNRIESKSPPLTQRIELELELQLLLLLYLWDFAEREEKNAWRVYIGWVNVRNGAGREDLDRSNR